MLKKIKLKYTYKISQFIGDICGIILNPWIFLNRKFNVFIILLKLTQ